MTTEVQIGRNGTHLIFLQKVITRTASWLGMSRKDIQETEDAVSQACLVAMGDSGEESTTPLNVRVSADAACVTVDITNPHAVCVPLSTSEYADDGQGAMSLLGRLVDSVELISADDGATIRITKRARKVQGTAAVSAAYLSTSLQS